jgi:hypothetical protein
MGRKLVDLSADLSSAFAQEGPSISFIRVVLPKMAWFSKFEIELERFYRLNQVKAVLSTDEDEDFSQFAARPSRTHWAPRGQVDREPSLNSVKQGPKRATEVKVCRSVCDTRQLPIKSLPIVTLILNPPSCRMLSLIVRGKRDLGTRGFQARSRHAGIWRDFSAEPVGRLFSRSAL